VTRLALPALAAAALMLSPSASGTVAKTKTARLGDVEATVSWKPAGAFEAKDVLLVIKRSGEIALQATLGHDAPQTIRVRDLDADGEPEVVLDLYTGGAHCCFYSRIYRFAESSYVPLQHGWGDLGYRLRDLDGDGAPELVSADDRFAYAFTAYAGSAFPVEIWDYRAARIFDVTRHYPALVRRDSSLHWKDYLQQRRGSYRDPRGILAAWLADQYLLGQQRHGWTVMARLNRRHELRGPGRPDYWPTGRRYLTKLRKFLVRYGYA
jgi:hypothetical protein